MRVRLLGAAVVLVAVTAPVGIAAAQGGARPWMDTSLSAEERTALLLPQMTLEEKVELMTGDPPPGTGAYFNAAIPRLGIPELRTVDIGPGSASGHRADDRLPDGHRGRGDLEHRLGAAGRCRRWPQEARRRGTTWCWARTSTSPRNPWWSRIGETFGEDPLLSGLMAAGFVRGAQAKRDMAVNLKHYNVYTQETNRRRGGEHPELGRRRADAPGDLHAAVGARRSPKGLASVMCAYNRVNGEHACEHGYLQEQVLRRQLGFDGFVLTDFGASYPHTVDSIEDGMDVETGSIVAYGPSSLLAAVQDGRVSEALVDERVCNILRMYFKFGVFDRPLPATPQPVPVEEHGGLAREIEQEAITLLKNRNARCRCSGPTGPRSIAVIGEGATWAAQQCCAGAVTSPTYTITPAGRHPQRAPAGRRRAVRSAARTRRRRPT